MLTGGVKSGVALARRWGGSGKRVFQHGGGTPGWERNLQQAIGDAGGPRGVGLSAAGSVPRRREGMASELCGCGNGTGPHRLM